ncbi:DNA methyltransferase [Tepidanaerobacter syntrophicus]|uniref:DNA methyltransferase n=1 Tax=Tepidanaerobacter syntrophicus TaxID=224999 RepID=UPI001BD46F4A|nr:DNA methyltransferase [Tepidanaerobacter syntrophicus]
MLTNNDIKKINIVRHRYDLYDYKGIPASDRRYSIHQYPAMLHYMLVRELLIKYSTDSTIVYDPFCGSGVTITESILQKRKVLGSDINPLGLLITNVRSSNYEQEELLKIYNDFNLNYDGLIPDIPEIKNIDYWFKPQVINDLGKIRKYVSQISNIALKEFVLVVFSETARRVSNNRNGEFKRFRLDESSLNNYNPDTINTFKKIFIEYMNILTDNPIPDTDFALYLHDVRQPLPFNEKVDLVITSPPYGDSRTTVAYGQFSSFALDWIYGLNPFGDANLSLDKLSLGGKNVDDVLTLPSGTLNTTLNKIYDKNPQRAKDVYSFFYDLYLCCKQIVNQLNEHAIVCFIVGNRQVAGVEIPMDYIVAEFFTALGLEYINTLVRKISNKRMPMQNSPSNMQGRKSTTMKYEYVVVCRR